MTTGVAGGIYHLALMTENAPSDTLYTSQSVAAALPDPDAPPINGGVPLVVVNIVRETTRLVIAIELSAEACRSIAQEQGCTVPISRKHLVNWLERVIHERLPNPVAFP